ncbi:MAG: hypothetical protein ACOYL5_05345 [Phototrophicaceae bacterium]|jgi:hypothetical protein
MNLPPPAEIRRWQRAQGAAGLALIVYTLAGMFNDSAATVESGGALVNILYVAGKPIIAVLGLMLALPAWRAVVDEHTLLAGIQRANRVLVILFGLFTLVFVGFGLWTVIQ